MTLHDDMVAASVLPAHKHVQGQSVTYHLSGEDDVVFTAVFIADRSDLVDVQPGGRDDIRTGSLQVAKTDLASPSDDATVTIGSALWHVITHDDGGAFWMLNLKRSVATERANEPFRVASS